MEVWLPYAPYIKIVAVPTTEWKYDSLMLPISIYTCNCYPYCRTQEVWLLFNTYIEIVAVPTAAQKK